MSEMKAIYLKDYKAPEFKISKCDLVFELFEDYTQVTNMMKISKEDKDSKDLVLDSIDLELIELYLDEVKLDDIGEKEGSEDKQKKQPVSNTPSRLDRKVKEVKSMKLDLDSKPRATLKKSSKSKLAVDGKSKKKEEPKKKKRVYNPRTNKFEFR